MSRSKPLPWLIEVAADPYREDQRAVPVSAQGHAWKAALDRAIANGLPWLHESGTFVKFTEAGAALFP